MSSSDKRKRIDCNCKMCFDTYSNYCKLKGVSCLMCKKKSSADSLNPVVILQKCSACLLVSYCSSECQKKHWPMHKICCIQYRRDSPCPFTHERMKQTVDDYIRRKGPFSNRITTDELPVKIAEQSENDNGLFHPETINWTASLVPFYHFKGKAVDALNTYKKLYLISCTMLGPLHKNSLIKLADIAVCYTKLGEFDEAMK